MVDCNHNRVEPIMPDTNISMDFTLMNDLVELDRLIDQLKQFRSRAGLNPRCFNEINLALEELFANFVHHAHPNDGTHFIRFSLTLSGHTLIITTEDDGIPFDPQSISDPDVQCPLEKRQIGGLGIMLIKKIMDKISYKRIGDKNRIQFTKYIDDLQTCLDTPIDQR
jgi:anti-sigma regulatory factor (Ser/Thr protein kinase)